MALPGFLAPLAGAAISTFGNLFGASKSSDATREANAMALADKERDRELQREFAQSGIQWRVADAIKAGIHPLAALGGSGATYSPSAISISPDTSMGTALAASGQDISRAMNATRSQGQRDAAFTKSVQDLSLQKLGLENELLASQIAKLRSSLNPPMPDNVGGGPVGVLPGPGPVMTDAKPENAPNIQTPLGRLDVNPRMSNADSWTKRFGESELFETAIGLAIMFSDLAHNTGKILPSAGDWQRFIRARRPPGGTMRKF